MSRTLGPNRTGMGSVFEPRPMWMRYALCQYVDDPSIFFPGRGESTAEAKAICAECPAQDACAEAGMKEKHGIWGGLSARERRRIRRRRNLPEPTEMTA